MTLRRRLGLVIAVVAVGLTAFAASQGIAQAATNSDEAPHPGNSSPNDAHTFLLRRSSNFGVNDSLQFIAYYPKDITDTQWRNGYLRFRPGGNINEPLVCQTDATGLSNAQKKRYISVKLEVQGGSSITYHIPYGRACDYEGDSSYVNKPLEDDFNRIFATYQLPGNNAPPESALNSETNRFYVLVTVSYNDAVRPNEGNTGNTAQFDVKGNTDGLRIGQRGGGGDGDGDGFKFPLRPAYWHANTRPNASSAVDVPFGLPCNITGTTKITKKIGLYDADNNAIPFRPHEVKFRVQEVGGGYVRFNSGTERRGQIQGPGNTVFRPNDGEALEASVRADFKPQTQYVMEITGIANGNIIDVQVPGDTIFGVIDCKWEMRPDSAVSPSIQRPGQPVTFTHTATNIKAFKSDPVTSKVMWGKRGVRATGGVISTDANRIYNPNNNTESRTFTNNFTIPVTARDGDEYCQYLEVQPHSYDDNTAYDSWRKGDRACVRVETPIIPPEVVGITPVVNGNMDYVEPTETATFDGYVNVTNFPRMLDDEWGYTEVARQRPATRVTPTATSGLQTDGPYTTARQLDTAAYYSCHTGDSRSGAECTHPRPAYSTKAGCENAGYTWSGGSCTSSHSATYHPATYKCPATYVMSGSQCTRTRYKCATTSTWGAWNASPPSCPSYWTCPGGAAGSGYSHAAPNCQGWKCQYAPYTQVNQATAPACEYRCSDGTGIRAPQSNGWTGDMNCYVQPRFTLTCYWKNKPSFSETVTTDGRYCNNRDFDANEAGVTIGIPVRAVLTANYPGNSAWSSPPPGYRLNRQAVLWGWNNFPSRSAEDTVRVVGKPTVKIRGGDVAAGGAFASGTNCIAPVNTAGIAGWPGPSYTASGTQFGAFAAGSITGFSTNMIRSGAPRDLAFANRPLSGGERFGGSFSPITPCIPDYYSESTQAPARQTITLTQFNNGTASGAYRATAGGEIDSDPAIEIEKGRRITIYVDGNVYINGSGIRYKDRGRWQSTPDIPGFKLVVKGNIYIAPSVTELNGIYIAQPRTTTVGGNIYTCATSTAAMPDSQIYNNCQNPLTVNGAFIAKKVHFLRSQGTAIRGDTSEQLNYLPELWLTNWQGGSSSSSVKYDAIIALPPIL